MQAPDNSHNTTQPLQEVVNAKTDMAHSPAAAEAGILQLASLSLSASVSESDIDSPPLSPQRSNEEERWADNYMDDHNHDDRRGNGGGDTSPLPKTASLTKGNKSATGTTNINTHVSARTPPRHQTIHNNYPYSSASPRVTQSYVIGRTQSSPSIIDASPKMRKSDFNQKQFQEIFSLSPKPGPILISGTGTGINTGTSGRVHHTSQLTPVARNTTRPFGQNTSDNNSASAIASGSAKKEKKFHYLSVPETNSFHNNQSLSSSSSSSLGMSKNLRVESAAHGGRGEGSSNNIIQPRRSTVTGLSASHGFNGNRPNIPQNWLSQRATSITEGADVTSTSLARIPSAGSSPHSSTSSPSSSKENTGADEYVGENEQENRFPSPLNARVKLDRNHYSFPSQHQHQHQQHHTSSPESIFSSNTPQPSSPPNDGHGQAGSLDIGTGPMVDENKNESLEDFLIIKPYQPSRDSSLASFGVNTDELDDIFLPLRRQRTSKSKSNRLRRGIVGGDSDDDDVDADDSCTNVSDSQSSTSFTSFTSFPSIRLGVRIRSSTQDSVTTAEGGVEGSSTFDEEDSLVFQQHQDGTLFIGSGGGNVGEKKKKKHGRCLSQKEEKQVYAWLRTLEVDKDNNEYVAEAASSKFLTGKMNNIDEYAIDCTSGRFVAPSEFGSRADHSKDEEQKSDVEDDDNNADTKGKKDSSVRSAISSSNKIVMGRNICAFDRNRSTSNAKKNTKAKSSSFKVSGLYR